MLIAEQRLFKRVENYYTNSLLYPDMHEVPVEEEDKFESSNEANEKTNSKSNNENDEWELNWTTLEALEMRGVHLNRTN